MICEHCGKNNHNSATYCRSCGEKLHRSEVRIPLRYGKTHRPGTEKEPKPEEAASPNEYFADPTDYGDKTLFANDGQTSAPPQKETPPTPPYPPVQAYPVRRKSRVPYLVVSHLTALLSVLCFILPLAQWVSYYYQLLDWSVSEGTLSLLDLCRKLYEDNNVVQFVVGEDNEWIASIVPENINLAYTQGRIAALAVAILFLISLVLFFLFIIMVLVRQRRVAAGFGITASLLYGGSCAGVMYAVSLLNGIVVEYNDTSWNIIQFKLLNMPYINLGLAVLLFVLCIVFAALGAGTDRRRR